MPVVLDVRVVTGSGGGPEKTILSSPRYLAPHGYRMLCAYLHPPNDPGFETLRRKAEQTAAPLISIPDRGAWDWRVATQLLAHCKREKVSIWHGHDYKSNALGLLLRRFWPMRLVTTVHGWVKRTWKTPLYYRIDQLCLTRYEQVICVSDDLLDTCLQKGVPAKNCVLLENGIDLIDYRRQSDAADARKRLGLPGQGILLGAVGRLSDEKGFDLLIRSTHALVNAGQDLRLVILGEGEQRAKLAQLIRSIGLSDRVLMPGWQPDVRPYFEAMDVFVLSSLREGLPNVLLEAMAMEVPVLAARVNGVPRIIQAEGNGLLFNPGNLEEMTAGLGRIVQDAALRNRLAESGRRTVESRYSFATRMQRLKQLYDELLRSRRGVT